MKILRKLIQPIAIWFGLAFFVILAFQYFTSVNSNQAAALADFEHYYDSFSGQVDAYEKLALGLALEASTNPDIQKAFALQDRETLRALTEESYKQLDARLGVPQYQYHLPPAISFLRLHQPEKFGDDLSSFRATVLEANKTQKEVAGLEIGRGGLGVRGVEPVFYQGKHVGSVEFGLNVDTQFLAALRGEYSVDWQLWLLSDAAQIATFEPPNTSITPPSPELVYQTSTLNIPVLNRKEAYFAALQGKETLNRMDLKGQNLAVFSAPLKDYSGKVIGVVDIVQDRTPIVQANTKTLVINLALLALTMASAIAIVVDAGQRALRPIRDLMNAAREIANGNLERQAEINSGDELQDLSETFNAMTLQLRELINNLESRVQERTAALQESAQRISLQSAEIEESKQRLERRAAQLEAISEVAGEIASIQKIEKILPQIVQLISEKFGFYHVGIFLVDENHEYAILVAANSEGGKRMLARGHKLQVGKVGIVGYATGSGNPRIALDTGLDAVYFNNPDLPNTRSEMALPLHSSRGVIGALDVQSVEPNAFTQEDIRVLSALADQISIAIENDRLFEQTQKSLAEVETFYRQYMRKEWDRLVRSENLLGVRYQNGRSQMLEAPLAYPALQQAVLTGETLKTYDTEANMGNLTIPVSLRGEVIGVLNVRATGKKAWQEDEQTLTQAVAERLAIALENARLVDDSQRRANKERTISEIATRISSSVNMRNVLENTITELERILPGADIVIQFAAPADSPESSAPKS